MRSTKMKRNALAAAVVVVLGTRALGADAPPTSPSGSHTQPSANAETTPTAWSSGIYGYDGAGNIKQIGSDVYRYDPIGRLARATAGTAPVAPGTVPVNQQVFTYDRYGNLATASTTTTAGTMVRGYAVQAATNQLDGSCTGDPDICLLAVYDALGSGRQVGLDAPGQYTWDALGMMTTMSHRGERYVYDANDERIVTVDTVQGSTARYTLRAVDNAMTRELLFVPATNTWSLKKDYVYRAGALAASFSGTQTEPDRHYHPDHLGSTRVVTNGSGHRLAVHTYWPFGLEADGSDTDTERVKFTGHERDISADGFVLDYMHARYYDPNLGRFLSVDPVLAIESSTNNPQGWNRYTYARNNPLVRIDPDGKRDIYVAVWNARFPYITDSGSVGHVGAFELSGKTILSQFPTPHGMNGKNDTKSYNETVKFERRAPDKLFMVSIPNDAGFDAAAAKQKAAKSWDWSPDPDKSETHCSVAVGLALKGGGHNVPYPKLSGSTIPADLRMWLSLMAEIDAKSPTSAPETHVVEVPVTTIPCPNSPDCNR